MKRSNKFKFFLFFTLVVFLFLPVYAMAAGSITWYDYDKGLALAKEKKKKVYINFYADWCGYCKKMEKETFVDSKVISYLSDHFISVRLNSDKERKLATQYSVRGLPANYFLTESGDTIGNQPGYLDAETFMKVLNFIKEEKYKKGNK